jgi:hypothetical protein
MAVVEADPAVDIGNVLAAKLKAAIVRFADEHPLVRLQFEMLG